MCLNILKAEHIDLYTNMEMKEELQTLNFKMNYALQIQRFMIDYYINADTVLALSMC